MQELQKKFIDRLYSLGAIKFGNFKLKSGKVSPYYVDLRLLISYPELLNLAGILLSQLFKNQIERPNLICGIASAGVPIATVLSQRLNLPMINTKKEPLIYKEIGEKLDILLNQIANDSAIKNIIKTVINPSHFKGHGLQKYIDGHLQENSKIGLIDDLITTAKSKLEAKELIILEKKRTELKNITVTDAYVLLDREQGGPEILEKNNIKIHSVIKITEVLDYLFKNNSLDIETYKLVKRYIDREKNI
jgi:uridine monophosphate synthetase